MNVDGITHIANRLHRSDMWNGPVPTGSHREMADHYFTEFDKVAVEGSQVLMVRNDEREIWTLVDGYWQQGDILL